MSKKIVVTGALGHIGSRLIRDLPAFYPGVEIQMIDNLSTQRYPALFDLPEETYRFIEGDVCQLDMLPLVKGAIAVIHLAALTDAAGSFNRKEQVEQANFSGTERVAMACAEADVPLLYPSSTSVYGTQNEVVDENCTLEELQPQSPYAETKLKEEALLTQLAKQRGLRHATCRFGTIYGISPGMRFHTAVNKFCWQAVMGKPLTVWSTAYDQKRPYLDLGDAVRSIAFLIEKDLFSGQIYNVLSQNTTVRRIVETIQAAIPETKVAFVDNRIMNQLSYEVARTRFCNLGFEFLGRIEDGIAATIQLLSNANGHADRS